MSNLKRVLLVENGTSGYGEIIFSFSEMYTFTPYVYSGASSIIDRSSIASELRRDIFRADVILILISGPVDSSGAVDVWSYIPDVIYSNLNVFIYKAHDVDESALDILGTNLEIRSISSKFEFEQRLRIDLCLPNLQ